MRELLIGISFLSFIFFTFYAFAINNYLLALITALIYFIDPFYDVTTSSYSAKIIPDEIRGRVTSLTRLVVLAAHSCGFFIAGILLQYFGNSITIVFFSALLFLLAVSTIFNRSLKSTVASE